MKNEKLRFTIRMCLNIVLCFLSIFPYGYLLSTFTRFSIFVGLLCSIFNFAVLYIINLIFDKTKWLCLSKNKGMWGITLSILICGICIFFIMFSVDISESGNLLSLFAYLAYYFMAFMVILNYIVMLILSLIFNIIVRYSSKKNAD